MMVGHIRPRVDWSALDDALARSRDAGCVPSFWWRDDDAVRHTPALDRLLALAREFQAPLALAAIPALAEPSLRERLADEPLATVLVHGHAHANHAAAGEKKAEFGPHRPLGDMIAEAGQALATAREAFSRPADARGATLVPVFVPPWNRASPELIAALPGLGYRGLSLFKDRATRLAAPGLVEVNAHLDPIDWRGGGGLIDAAVLAATLAQAVTDRAEGRADLHEAIGLLTHHLVHDDAVWAFCEELVAHLSHRHGMRFRAARVLFDIDKEDGADRSATHHG